MPRAEGRLTVSSKARDGENALDTLRTSGCLKTLFPLSRGPLEIIAINTSGGLTSGDQIGIEARAGAASHMSLTTQAAERAYRAADGPATVTARLTVEDGATLFWLPQELILFDGAALHRRLEIALAPTSRLLMVEPIVFGRAAMGETVDQLAFRDRIRITRRDQPLYADGIDLIGDARAHLAHPATARRAGAIASLIYVAPDAEAHLQAAREMLPPTGGATLLQPDMLALRLAAPDSFQLRRHLLPILDRLSRNTLPKSWRL